MKHCSYVVLSLPHTNHPSVCNAAYFMYIVKLQKWEIRLQSGFFTWSNEVAADVM